MAFNKKCDRLSDDTNEFAKEDSQLYDDNINSSLQPQIASQHVEEQEKCNEASLSDAIGHLPPLAIDSSVVPPKEQLTATEAILAASDSLSADNDTQLDKIRLAQAVKWVPITYQCKDKSHGFLTSLSTISSLMQTPQPQGIWQIPLPDPVSSQLLYTTHPQIDIDVDMFIKDIKTKSSLNNSHAEMTEEQCALLNKDWLEYPQMWYCGSQLLVGAILVDGQTVILLNTVEPYSRDTLLDAHLKRRSAGPSSFPTTQGRYGYLLISLIPSVDGVKLMIGTRLDIQSVKLGPETTHFQPSKHTRVYIDSESIDLVKPMLHNRAVDRSQVMPSLYQLKQTRSKFNRLSTYSKCRASS